MVLAKLLDLSVESCVVLLNFILLTFNFCDLASQSLNLCHVDNRLHLLTTASNATEALRTIQLFIEHGIVLTEELTSLGLAFKDFAPGLVQSLFNILLEGGQFCRHGLQALSLLTLKVSDEVGGRLIGELPREVLLLSRGNEL